MDDENDTTEEETEQTTEEETSEESHDNTPEDGEQDSEESENEEDEDEGEEEAPGSSELDTALEVIATLQESVTALEVLNADLTAQLAAIKASKFDELVYGIPANDETYTTPEDAAEDVDISDFFTKEGE